MEHERLGVGVVEEVPELLVEVPIVHVHRHAAHLERGVLRFEVLVAVVEEQPDLGVVTEPRRAVGARRDGRRARRTPPRCGGSARGRGRPRRGSRRRSTPRSWRSASPSAGSVGDRRQFLISGGRLPELELAALVVAAHDAAARVVGRLADDGAAEIANLGGVRLARQRPGSTTRAGCRHRRA